MDVKRLKYFCTIVEQGQINRAAKVLHISQSPLCQRLKELEDELGTVLISRGRGQWEVTEAGKLLYGEARQLLDGLENIRSHVENVGSAGISGVIHIGVSPMCQTRLLSTLQNISNTYPQLRFRISVLDSSEVEESVSDGTIDIGLQILPVLLNVCEVTPLKTSSFCLVFSPDHPLADHKTVTLKELAAFSLMIPRRNSGTGYFEKITEAFSNIGVTPHIVIDSDNVQTLIRLVELGTKAAALVPASEFSQSAYPKLCVAKINENDLAVTPALVVKKHRYKTRAMRAVIDSLIRCESPSRPLN